MNDDDQWVQKHTLGDEEFDLWSDVGINKNLSKLHWVRAGTVKLNLKNGSFYFKSGGERTKMIENLDNSQKNRPEGKFYSDFYHRNLVQ